VVSRIPNRALPDWDASFR
jgi:C-terminal processing protease CtpA/Prc